MQPSDPATSLPAPYRVRSSEATVPIRCEGSVLHRTRQDAQDMALGWRNNSQAMRAYYCERCIGWHLKSLDPPS